MANYTTVFKVKTLVTTSKKDSEIVSVIQDSDSFIDNMLGGSGAPANMLADWSARLTAYKIQSMTTLGGITGNDTSNVSRIKIGDAEIQTGTTTGASSGSNASTTGNLNDWRSQVIQEITYWKRSSRLG